MFTLNLHTPTFPFFCRLYLIIFALRINSSCFSLIFCIYHSPYILHDRCKISFLVLWSISPLFLSYIVYEFVFPITTWISHFAFSQFCDSYFASFLSCSSLFYLICQHKCWWKANTFLISRTINKQLS